MPLLTRSRGSPVIPTNFPPEVRFTVKVTRTDAGDTGVAIVEDAPQLRSILYKVGKSTGDAPPHRFLIRKPWSYMLVQYGVDWGATYYGSCNLWFSRKRIESLNDPGLLAVPLPNVIYNTTELVPHYRCCMGLWHWRGHDAAQLPADTHHFFWSSVFNDEYGDANYFIPPELAGSREWKNVLETWQKLEVEPGWKTVEGLSNYAPIHTLDDALRGSFAPKYEIL